MTARETGVDTRPLLRPSLQRNQASRYVSTSRRVGFVLALSILVLHIPKGPLDNHYLNRPILISIIAVLQRHNA